MCSRYLESRDESHHVQRIWGRCFAKNQEARLQLYSNVRLAKLQRLTFRMAVMEHAYYACQSNETHETVLEADRQLLDTKSPISSLLLHVMVRYQSHCHQVNWLLRNSGGAQVAYRQSPWAWHYRLARHGPLTCLQEYLGWVSDLSFSTLIKVSISLMARTISTSTREHAVDMSSGTPDCSTTEVTKSWGSSSPTCDITWMYSCLMASDLTGSRAWCILTTVSAPPSLVSHTPLCSVLIVQVVTTSTLESRLTSRRWYTWCWWVLYWSCRLIV